MGPSATILRISMSRVPRRSSGLASFIATPRNSTYILEFAECQHFPASGEANGDRCRDSERFISTCNDLQEHGRHPMSLQDNIRHCNCVPRCVPRSVNSSYHVLIETHGSDVGSSPFQIFFPVLRLIPD